jgi:hypothetical protein
MPSEHRVIGNISPILWLMTPGIDKCALLLIEVIREYVSHKKYPHRIGEEANGRATHIVAELAASPCGNHLDRDGRLARASASS